MRDLQSSSLWTGFAFLIVLTLIVLAALPSPSSANSSTVSSEASQKQASPEFVPGEVLVRYRSESAAQRKTQVRQSMLSVDGRQLSVQIERFDGAEIVSGLRLARVATEDTFAAIEALQQQPDVLYAEANYVLYLDATPNDPNFNQLYGLLKIGAPQAWDVIKGSKDTAQAGFGSPRIVVGVIDEGIDINHEDLLANIWTNPAEMPTPNGIDDDGNGFIDDIHGYDFALNSGTITGQGHGTHVAGTIGAVGNNATGVVGVNWSVGLMSLKFVDASRADTADAIRACNYAKQMRDLWVSTGGLKGANLRVLNNSYGSSGYSQSFLDAINALNQSGILMVAAAGNLEGFSVEPDNDRIPHYPASYDAPNVIAVAATDQNDGLWSSSHFGLNSVQLGAPGVGILSTLPGNTYGSQNGTSMACPQVAGAAALLLARNPNLTTQQLRALLIFNGDLVPSLSGKTLTGRRLNVANSLQALNDNDTTPPGTVTNFNVISQNGRTLDVGWTASGDDGAVGQASLYRVTFTDATTGAVILVKNVLPVVSGVTQAISFKLPYRHTSGTLTLREFDNAGNEGVAATLGISVSPIEGDPYLISLGSPVALSTGGTGLSFNCDDCFKTQTLPFSFSFFGEIFPSGTSVTVSSNGSLYFSPPPATDSTSSLLDLSERKMIAGLWSDLDLRTSSRAGADVYVVTSDPTRIIFRWQGVNFSDTPALRFPVNFEIELRSNGTILTRYGAGNTRVSPVVGISGGEPDTYVIDSYTSKYPALTSLSNFPEVTFLPRAVGISNVIQFSAPQFQGFENTGVASSITVTRIGDTTTQSSVDYVTTDGNATQKGDYTFRSGTINFAAGESSKSIAVLIIDDVYQESTETFSIMLSNPSNATIGARSVAAIAVFDNDFGPAPNPLDNPNAQFFVRQQYLDFLNRDPDAGGLAFWSGQITACGNNAACIDDRHINVSAAFFLSIEFQETGYLVYKLYKAAYGNLPGGAPVPVRYYEFQTDTQQIALGVMVGIGDWQTQLENNKQAFATTFVTRSRFATLYPATMSPADFVGALYANAEVTPSAAERLSVIAEFGSQATTTVNIPARARVLRRVADNAALGQQELNKAFVLTQYFGYLRRNPYDPPESTLDYGGFNFWLGKLNQFNGNYVAAQMVKAFLDSDEYRHRFAP